jgi:MOSC domain-containing protein YiiM
MRRDIAELIANGQPLTVFGDNLLVDFDLSAANLPPGSRLRLGEAVVEVTPKPHNGCKKFQGRFGADALRFVASPATRDQNRRGIYWKIVTAGEVATGAPIRLLSRSSLGSGS